MIERLTEIYPCNKCNVEFCSRLCYRMTRWAEKAKEKLDEYETAEEEGRIKILPCTIGDMLFVLTPHSPTGIESTKCSRILIGKRGVRVEAPSVYDDWGNARWNFKVSHFGKDVFLDLEKAKKALKEMEEM